MRWALWFCGKTWTSRRGSGPVQVEDDSRHDLAAAGSGAAAGTPQGAHRHTGHHIASTGRLQGSRGSVPDLAWSKQLLCRARMRRTESLRAEPERSCGRMAMRCASGLPGPAVDAAGGLPAQPGADPAALEHRRPPRGQQPVPRTPANPATRRNPWAEATCSTCLREDVGCSRDFLEAFCGVSDCLQQRLG